MFEEPRVEFREDVGDARLDDDPHAPVPARLHPERLEQGQRGQDVALGLGALPVRVAVLDEFPGEPLKIFDAGIVSDPSGSSDQSLRSSFAPGVVSRLSLDACATRRRISHSA